MFDALEKSLRTLWVGGPDGETFLKFQNQLDKIGISIFEQWNDRQAQHHDALPVDTDLVLINVDYIGHPAQYKIKRLAKSQGLRWCFAGLSTISTTIPNLIEKKILMGTVEHYANIINPRPSELEVEKEEVVNRNVPYMDKFTQAVNKFVGENFSNEHLMYFLQPEWQRKSDRVLRLLASRPREFGNYEPDLRSLTIAQDWNLSTWRTARNVAYDTALRKLFVLAAHGFVERIEPYLGQERSDMTEPTISFNFRLSETGKEALVRKPEPVQDEQVSEPKQGAAAPEIVVRAHPEKPNGISEAMQLIRHKSATVEVEAQENNFTMAIKLLLEVAQEDPDVLAVNLDIVSKRVEITKRSKIAFKL